MKLLGPVELPELPFLDFEYSSFSPLETKGISDVSWLQSTIDWVLAEYMPGHRQGFTLINKVFPKQVLDWHTDKNDNHCRTRVHIPLTADPECVFCSDGGEYNMQVGFVYLINPTAPHSVKHRGTRDRIHLMFNAIKGD